MLSLRKAGKDISYFVGEIFVNTFRILLKNGVGSEKLQWNLQIIFLKKAY